MSTIMKRLSALTRLIGAHFRHLLATSSPMALGGLFGLVLWAASWAMGYGLSALVWLWPAPAPHLAAKLETGGVVLNWRVPDGQSVHHLVIYRNHQYLAYTRSTGYVDSSIKAGMSYNYSVVAVGADHHPSAASNAAKVKIPAILAAGTTVSSSPPPSASPSPGSPAGLRGKVQQLFSGQAPADPTGNPFVTRQGTQLMLAGQPFHFTGLNIYNANSRGNCYVTLGEGSGLDQALTQWGPGKTVMRAWFYQTLATSGGHRDWAAFDHTLAVARAHGVRVIATLGDQWGDCEDGQYKTAAWYAGGYRGDLAGGIVAYRAWVAEVAARYKDDPTIMAWQLMNEAETKTARNEGCAAGGPDTLRAFATDLGGLVRSLDPNHLVSLGTIGGGQCGTQGSEYEYVHASPGIDLCEYHDYNDPTSPLPGDQWNGLAARVAACRALGKPLFVGEIGIKPGDVGGSLPARADAYARKINAGFGAGVAGELVWAWRSSDGYEVGPGDPALAALAQF
jgi:mannan endo-1,4-beta-mannosidase